MFWGHYGKFKTKETLKCHLEVNFKIFKKEKMENF